MSNRTLLTSPWRHLVMLDYRINPDILRPDIPRGVALDLTRLTTNTTWRTVDRNANVLPETLSPFASRQLRCR